MPKSVKGNAGRKPPEPSATHAEIDAWIKTSCRTSSRSRRRSTKSIRAAVPGLHYAVRHKRAFYGVPELGWIIELAPYDVSVDVLFFGGTDFDSPPKLGSAERTRYVKVTSLAEARQPELLDWTNQAGRTPGWK